MPKAIPFLSSKCAQQPFRCGEAQICGKDSWAEWFNASTYTGRDVGSTLAKWPTDEALVGWAEALLDFKGAA